MAHKVIKGPNGKFQTADHDQTGERQAIEKLRKEVRDMIQGNTQFHDDPYKVPPKPKEVEDTDETGGIPEYWHHCMYGFYQGSFKE